MLHGIVAQFGEPAPGVVGEPGVLDSEQTNAGFAVEQMDGQVLRSAFRVQHNQAAQVAGALVGVW